MKSLLNMSKLRSRGAGAAKVGAWLLAAVMMLGICAPQSYAQKRKTRTTTTSSTQKRKSAASARTVKKKSTARRTPVNKRKTSSSAKPAPNVNTLRSQRDALQKKISQSQTQLAQTNRDVKKQLSNLAVINAQIESHRRNIDTIRTNINRVNVSIGNLENEVSLLSAQLRDRKQKYARSMLYLYQNRKTSNKLLFLLSSKDFAQMARRYRYVKEYSKYQRVQGELVQRKQAELLQAKTRLNQEKDHHTQLLAREEVENRNLAVKQNEQQSTVSSLQKKQKNLQQVIASGQKEMAALNAKIDYYVKLAIEQERRRREEAERKAREAEQRRKEMAAAAERSRQREEAREAARKSASASSKSTKTVSKGKENASASAGNRSKAAPAPEPAPRYQPNNRDYQLTSNFASNKGRLPIPITGSYLISTHYGSYTLSGMKVRLDSKGINLTGQQGAQARCIFDGEVTAVFTVGGLKNVMVRHGSYISVYCNLRSVSVSQGQRVSARQSLGAVAADASGKPNLHFQLRHETATLNPEQWLAR